MVTLNEISQLLYGTGDESPGWQGSEEELISLAAKTFPGKVFCVVKQWILIDFSVTLVKREKLTSLGLIPATLFAHEIVLDSKGRFQPAMWVRSNFGKFFSEGCKRPAKSSTQRRCYAPPKNHLGCIQPHLVTNIVAK